MSKKLTSTDEAMCACADFSTAITKKDKEYIRVLEANHRVKSDNLQATKKELEEVKDQLDKSEENWANEVGKNSHLTDFAKQLQAERDELRDFVKSLLHEWEFGELSVQPDSLVDKAQSILFKNKPS